MNEDVKADNILIGERADTEFWICTLCGAVFQMTPFQTLPLRGPHEKERRYKIPPEMQKHNEEYWHKLCAYSWEIYSVKEDYCAK